MTIREPGQTSAATLCPPPTDSCSPDEEDLDYLTPLATLAIGVIGPIEALLEAYRTGGGVPYEAYGPDTREGIGALTGRSSSNW